MSSVVSNGNRNSASEYLKSDLFLTEWVYIRLSTVDLV